MQKQISTKKQTHTIIIVILIVILSLLFGYISNDFFIGGVLLTTSLLGSYLAGIGKRTGYIAGLINVLLISYVSYKNNLFGSFAVNAFIFAPLQVYGFISWGKHLKKDSKVKVRKFTFKKSLLVISSCVISSALFGYFLTRIPGQQLAFMDSAINCLEICALILLNLRYKENWLLWILSGSMAVVVWIVALINGGDNAFMRLIAAISALVMDTYGAIKWYSKTTTKNHN